MIRQMLKILALISFFLLVSDITLAAERSDVELASMDFEIKESGVVYFSVMLSIPQVGSEVSIPNFGSEVLRVYTANGKDLNYKLVNESLIISLENLTGPTTLTAELSSQFLTSKEGSEWIFEMDALDELEANNIIASVTFPYNSTLKVHSEPAYISSENNYLLVEWLLTDETVKKIYAQYTVNTPEKNQVVENEDSSGISIFLVVAGIILIVLLLGLAVIAKNIYKKEKEYVSDMLIGREVEIVNLLRKSRKGLTQNKIGIELGIPKSTLSRTLKRLEQRKIVSVNDLGHKNLVILKK